MILFWNTLNISDFWIFLSVVILHLDTYYPRPELKSNCYQQQDWDRSSRNGNQENWSVIELHCFLCGIQYMRNVRRRFVFTYTFLHQFLRIICWWSWRTWKYILSLYKNNDIDWTFIKWYHTLLLANAKFLTQTHLLFKTLKLIFISGILTHHPLKYYVISSSPRDLHFIDQRSTNWSKGLNLLVYACRSMTVLSLYKHIIYLKFSKESSNHTTSRRLFSLMD